VRVSILVAVGFFLAQHALLFEALLVHLVRDSEILVVVVVVGRVVVPPIPEPGIVAPTPPGITPAPAGEAETITGAKAESEAIAVATMASVESVAETITRSVVQIGCAGEARARRAVETAREASAHSTGKMTATSVAAGEAAVASAETGVASSKTCVTASSKTAVAAPAVTSATLCPERHGEEKSERRDEDQAAHTQLL